MTAREKLENLTNSWYGFALLAGLWSILQNGIGVISLVVAAGSTLFSFALTYFFGSRLRARSSLTRSFLVAMSALSMLVGTFGVYRMGSALLHGWSFALLFQIAFALVSLRMSFKSLRVLTDSSVAAYFR